MRAEWLLIGLAACGDPLVDGDYRGEVLASLEGTVVVEQGFDWPGANLRVAVFWATEGGGVGEEQSVVTTTAFPARYRLDLYRPPPASAFFHPEWATDDVAVATPLLYEDTDDSGTWSDDEPLVGGSPEIALVFSAQPDATFDLDEIGQGIPLSPGFQRMFSNGPICSAERGDYFPAADAPVDLYIGPYWDWFYDWDCNGETNEWDDFCPEEALLLEVLQSGDPEALDPFLLECADLMGVVVDGPGGQTR